VNWEKYLAKSNTASTPPISLMYAADKQLGDVLEETMENRWARHLQMRSITHTWVEERGFGFFAPEGYRSPTITCVDNTREIDVNAMASFMGERGFAIDKGYGKIKGKTFRIAHMGDMPVTTLEEYLGGLDEFLGV
ncbi:MAG: alanine--glyoxylate aminotransferase family protein, partial [Chloroflexota bacterium]